MGPGDFGPCWRCAKEISPPKKPDIFQEFPERRGLHSENESQLWGWGLGLGLGTLGFLAESATIP